MKMFKEIKIMCNECKNIIISKSDTEWTTCVCGSNSVMGKSNFMRINGKNYTDLSILNVDDLPENIQE